MQFSPQQDDALMAVNNWLKDPGGKQTFYLAGYAGTGKTTIARHLAEDAGKVLFGAFTGKAALVLRSKGCRGASTIHSMIYKVEDDERADARFILNTFDSPVKDADLVVIDEVSMVGEELGTDLLSFGKRVLVLGDPAQLPPVSGEGYFTARTPDFMLTEVHRQAAVNPIIHMSMTIREGRRLEIGSYGESQVMTRADITQARVVEADQVLVGLNKTRRLYNRRLREIKGFEGFFQIGDRVVCLKNNKEKGLLNGGIWTVREILDQNDETTEMQVRPLDAGMTRRPVDVLTHHAWLTGEERNIDWREAKKYQPFDFAYALTCHKAQGSQWDSVVVFDESRTFGEDRDRWLYTAVTRAAEKVTVVI